MNYGFGVEHELLMNFTDKQRKKRNMKVTSTSSNISNNPGYRSESAGWKESTGWKSSFGDVPIIQSGDSTVDGMPGNGNEIQSHKNYSKNVKIKWIIDQLFMADNDLSKEVKGSLQYVIPNPFGSAIGDFNKMSVGSFHISITFPYDNEKLSNTEYIRNYTNRVFNGLKVVRVIEPLFFSMIGGSDFGSVGKPIHAEGSSRQAYNGFANIGVTKLNDDTKRNWSYPKHGRGSSLSFNKKIYEKCGGKEENAIADILPKTFSNVPRQTKSVEFRFLDAFFAGNLYDTVKVLMLAMQHGENVPGIQDSRENDFWNDTTAEIIMEGWNARLPKGYLQLIKDKLNLDIPVKNDMRADIVFQNVVDKLWEKNKNGDWMRIMFDEYSKPKVMNLNRYNWDIQFRHKYVNEPEFTSYINNIIMTLSKIDATESGGWIKVKFDNTKITFRDVILDNTTYGLDMGVEDSEDILFLLERINAIKIKKNLSGHIDMIKVNFTDPKEISKKIDNLSTIEGVKETYFDTQSEAPVRIERPEPVRPEPVRPEPVRPEPVRPEPTTRPVHLRTTTTNIDMSRLSVSVVTPERDSPLDYNIREMEEIFNLGDFGVNISCYPAKIEYNSTSLLSFWIKTGNIVKVYLDYIKFGEDINVSRLMDRLRSGFYSPQSVSINNTFVDIPFSDFVDKLVRIAQSQYEKNLNNNIINLDKSGMETLKRFDIRIMSFSRGERYFIVNRKKANILKTRYGDKINLINYIPYQKRIYVQKFGQEFRLIMDGKMIDMVIK